MKKAVFFCALILTAAGLRAAVKTFVPPLALSTSTFMQTSVAMDSHNNIHMSYYDPSDQSLKYAKLTNGSAGWVISDITGAGVQVAPQNALALDNNRRPHVVYYRIDDIDGGVYHADFNGSSWRTELIDEPFVGTNTFVSIAIGSDNNPRVAYAHSPSSAAVFAKYDGVEWSTATIYISSAMGPLELALGPTDIPRIVFVASTSASGWVLGVGSGTINGLFSGWLYNTFTSTSIPARSLALALDSEQNSHVVLHDPSIVGSSFTYIVFDPDLYVHEDMPFTNPAYLIDTSTAPVFADIAVDSDDNALIVVSTGTQLDLYHYTGSDTPTKTTLESATVWSGIGVSLDLNRFDHAVVSCYSEDAGGGEVRFLTEAARGLSISGTVSDFTLAALPGVSLSLSGNIDNKSVLSDGVGAYSFGDLFEGHYTVTPSFSGYAFVPPSISLNSMMVNKPGQDFKGSLVDLDTQGNLIDPTKGEFVTFNYSVVPGHVSFIVYNLRGTHIKTLLDEDMGAVSSSVTWDGKDSNGEIVASGIYLFRFKSYQFEQKGKVAVVK